MDSSEEELEKAHWVEVIRAFLHYEDFIALDVIERQRRVNRLPAALANKLPDCSFHKFSRVSEAAARNQHFFNDLCDFQGFNFGPNTEKVQKNRGDGTDKRVPFSVMHRNQAVLHSLAREWSEEGKEERAKTFDPIIEELQKRLPVSIEKAYRQRVLVPGCGLARLPLEIASRGYSCEANEFSMFMLTASHFMLNGIYEKNSYDIYPWVDRVSNVIKLDDILSPIKVPDVSAVDLLQKCEYAGVDVTSIPHRKFSMAAGNFVEIYGGLDNEEQWDCVVTCFFVDTAPVVMDYVETIQKCLKPGGYWINLGPLLYHWASSDPDAGPGNDPDDRYSQSVELSWEELQHVICQYSFELCQEKDIECTYTRAQNSMLWSVYNAKFFTARKKDPKTTVSKN